MSYSPLSVSNVQIRHLIIEPALHDVDEISCRLETVLLGRQPHFVALSYRWGDSNNKTRALVDGKIVKITVSLDKALRELRRKRILRVWADGLCINQDDKEEQAQQVTIMDAIYRYAYKVLAWLGKEEYKGEAQDALSALKYLEAPKTRSSELSPPLRRALWKLLQSEYWRRVWIIQEVSVNEKLFILWGSQMFNMDSLRRPFEKNRAAFPANLNTQLRHIRNILYFRETQLTVKPPGLLEALSRSYRAQSSDPRDKVFALLSLTFDGHILLPSPSYVRSQRDTGIDLSSQIMRTSSSLNILLLRSSHDNTWVPNLFDGRTWKPEWRSRSVEKRPISGANYQKDYNNARYGAARSWQASRGQRAKATVHRSYIMVQAIIVDFVNSCFPTLSESLIPKIPTHTTNGSGVINKAKNQAPKSETKLRSIADYNRWRKHWCKGYKRKIASFPRLKIAWC